MFYLLFIITKIVHQRLGDVLFVSNERLISAYFTCNKPENQEEHLYL